MSFKPKLSFTSFPGDMALPSQQSTAGQRRNNINTMFTLRIDVGQLAQRTGWERMFSPRVKNEQIPQTFYQLMYPKYLPTFE